ncbi:MAG: hypothetical protein ABI954_01825 [Pyrinomonadaceae bacterium]
MKIKNIIVSFLLVLAFSAFIFAQNLKRTTTKAESADLGPGGTVTIVGAPKGSIQIEGWNQPNVEVTAEIQIEAATEEDLALLAQVNTFAFDDDANHIHIVTTGTHDKQFLKKNFKKLPKRLLSLPWRIDFKIKVPSYCDLEIDAGDGNFDLRGVEGAIMIKALQSERANLDLVGGQVQATFGGDEVNIKLSSRGWRGRGADIQVARGELNISVPPALNADLDLSVLRTGKIENKFEKLKPRDKTKFSETKMIARAGTGGATLVFTVGDGTLRLTPQ